jgi:hypothetical protein
MHAIQGVAVALVILLTGGLVYATEIGVIDKIDLKESNMVLIFFFALFISFYLSNQLAYYIIPCPHCNGRTSWHQEDQTCSTCKLKI